MKPLKILLVNVGRRRAMYPQISPPLGIMYIASYLRSRIDCDVRIISQKLDDQSNEEIARIAVDFEADVIGFSALTPTSFGLRQITHTIRKAMPEVLMLLGGPHVSSFQEKSLEDSAADAGVEGEGELAFEQIINAYFDGDPGLETVPGILRRDEEGNVVRNPGAIPLIDELDDLPFPAYDLIDLPEYWKLPSFAPVLQRKYVSLFSSRGCPYKCNFCHDVFGKRFRQHSAERAVAEIEHFKGIYGVDEFEFLDDIFNLNPKRVMDFCDLVGKKGLKLKLAFPNGVRTDIFRKETLDAMVDAGMYFCSFALESGSPRIQQEMGKELDVEKFIENVGYATSLGIYAQGFAMMGFPTETETDLKMTVEAACESRLHTLSVFTVTPYPNTPLYDIALKTCPDQLKRIDYQNMDYANVFVNLSEVSDEMLFAYQRKANRNFYLSPNRIFRILRDYPNSLPKYFAHFAPHFLQRATKGLLPSFGRPLQQT